MLRSRQLFWPLALMACAAPAHTARETVASTVVADRRTPRLEVHTDPRIEVVALMSRLAGFEEYQVRGVPQYDATVTERFARFRDHSSLGTLRRLRQEHGISHDAIPALALLAEPRTWRLRVTPEVLASADARWDVASANQFLDAVARFDAASGATAFFTAQDSIPRAMEAQLVAGLCDWVDIGWFAARYGLPQRARFVVVPGLQTGPLNYGLHVDLPDGTVEYYQIIGTPASLPGEEIRYPMREVRSLLVHELSHPFVNAWVRANARALEPGGRALFDVVRERMTANAYGDWESMLDESMARASTLRYFADHHDSAFVRTNMLRDREQGFLWTDELSRAMSPPGVSEGGGFDPSWTPRR